ncbi:methionine ABC transporter ATP-binding protein [Chenggangzhangella methanolivorans]|uniref:Cell division ATP-binding protein FtsE n=1 Tax=Chenggangzhangella methanolivorans TaxID=1437009 RepID=A0A9E6R7R5_9HYPH|nr:ATP-binding cassette domain-containing protein [Chenggangzhangella methanolivorans]QZN98844.1 ATP-binding cassette domain-containing protein [Chenggangzhangella methanolivorans]
MTEAFALARNPASTGRRSAEVVDIRPEPAKAAISFRGVAKTYVSPRGEIGALKNIDVEVPEGRVFGVIGRSGAGKSSLLRLVNRLESATTGQVIVDGEDVGALDGEALIALRRRVGMIFQHFNLLSAKTVYENVALPLRVAGWSREDTEKRVTEMLDLVGLSDKRDAYPGRLSGGQKQRVGIARALAGRPKILLCDEATSALDPETTQSILALLRDINRRLGITIMLITHEMSVIREVCDEVLVLEKGEVAEAGLVWRVFGDPRHPATKAMLAPLSHGLPDDLAGRVQSTPPRDVGEALVELSFRGERDPDLGAITASLGLSARVLSANLDRIGGHTQGRLLAALPVRAGAGPDLPENARVIGYVASND